MKQERRKYTHVCAHPHCRKTFHPFRRSQKYCSVSCGAAHRHIRAEDREARLDWLARGQETQRQKRKQIIIKKLEGCKSFAEAFRIGYRNGYNAGQMRQIRGARKLERAA